jgi:hypothetical protein
MAYLCVSSGKRGNRSVELEVRCVGETRASVPYYSFGITVPSWTLRIFVRLSSDFLSYLKLHPDAFHSFMKSFIPCIRGYLITSFHDDPFVGYPDKPSLYHSKPE